jgi:hypothetical protein
MSKTAHSTECCCCRDLLKGQSDRRSFMQMGGAAGLAAIFPLTALGADGLHPV